MPEPCLQIDPGDEDDLLTGVKVLLQNGGLPSRNRCFAQSPGEPMARLYRLYRIYASAFKEMEAALADPDKLVSARLEPGRLRLVVRDKRLAYRRECLVPGALQELFLKRLDAGAVEDRR